MYIKTDFLFLLSVNESEIVMRGLLIFQMSESKKMTFSCFLL